MEPTLQEIWKTSQNHFKEDKDFQDRIEKWFERAEPMIKAFEENNIAKMVFEKKTKTLFLYSRDVISVGGALVIIYEVIKYLLTPR